MARLLRNADIRRVVLVMSLYWAILLVASLMPGNLPIPESILIPCLVVGGLPTAWIMAFTLWRIAGDDAEVLAYKDDLTGIWNRRAFVRHAEALIGQSRAGTLALVLLDIDGLKLVNDACGHQAGDELLAAAARRLSHLHTSSYRIGGDEFAILIDRGNGTNVINVLSELEPFQARFVTCGHDHRVCLSYGYSSNREDDSFESLFRRADSRLRQFKRDLYHQGDVLDRREVLLSPSEDVSPAQISSLEERRKARDSESHRATS